MSETNDRWAGPAYKKAENLALPGGMPGHIACCGGVDGIENAYYCLEGGC